jgi:hypothetical protein
MNGKNNHTPEEKDVKAGAKTGLTLKELKKEVDNKMHEARSKVQEVDKAVADYVSKALAETGSGISDATTNASNAIKEHITQAGHHVERARDAIQKELQQLDEQHHIKSKVTSAVEAGKEFIAKNLGGQHKPSSEATTQDQQGKSNGKGSSS